jgi:hypothetical protein
LATCQKVDLLVFHTTQVRFVWSLDGETAGAPHSAAPLAVDAAHRASLSKKLADQRSFPFSLCDVGAEQRQQSTQRSKKAEQHARRIRAPKAHLLLSPPCSDKV